MEFDAIEAYQISSRWKDQETDLAGAATLVGDASTSGFTSRVKSQATSFRSRWKKILDDTSGDCGSQHQTLFLATEDWKSTDATAQERHELALYQQEHP